MGYGLLVVFIIDCKIYPTRSFTFIKEGCPFIPFLHIVNINRDSKGPLIAYRNGRFHVQHSGCHTMGEEIFCINVSWESWIFTEWLIFSTSAISKNQLREKSKLLVSCLILKSWKAQPHHMKTIFIHNNSTT